MSRRARFVLPPERTADNPRYEAGQIVSYAPSYLVNVSVPVLILGRVDKPPFPDVPLYRIRVLADLPGCTLPNYHTEPPSSGSVYPPVAKGEEVPNALWHNLSPL